MREPVLVLVLLSTTMTCSNTRQARLVDKYLSGSMSHVRRQNQNYILSHRPRTGLFLPHNICHLELLGHLKSDSFEACSIAEDGKVDGKTDGFVTIFLSSLHEAPRLVVVFVHIQLEPAIAAESEKAETRAEKHRHGISDSN